MLAAMLALAMAGPLHKGESSVAIFAGRPFYSLRLDHGLSDRFDVGAGLDVSASGFLRPLLRSRLRIWSNESARVSLRAAVAWAIPALKTRGFGPRPIASTGDGELGINLDLLVARRLWAFAELSALGQTDGKIEHSATFAQVLGGLEWATEGPLSLLGRVGAIQGSRGRALIGSVGAAWHF